MKNKKYKLPTPSRMSVKILRYGLPFVAYALLYTAFTYSSLDAFDAARQVALLYAQIEHAMMSLLLLVGGAVLFDIALRERR